ncbi:YjcZ family sporulation protein [Alkalihalobacterium elongatum]|nr:YjcZ family sporulation protein [Alkalihalobacterium elongatum]
MSTCQTPTPAFGGFTLIVVLFILLIIVGAAYC